MAKPVKPPTTTPPKNIFNMGTITEDSSGSSGLMPVLKSGYYPDSANQYQDGLGFHVRDGRYHLTTKGYDQSMDDGESRTYSFQYDVYNKSGKLTDTQTATVTVQGVNDAPTSLPFSGAGNEDEVLTVTAAEGLLKFARDAEGHTITPSIVTGPEHGDLVLNQDGSFSYTPDEDWFGTDTFTYSLSDGKDAKQFTGEIVIADVAEPEPPIGPEGVYLTQQDSRAILGPGWYHFGTSEDQIFVGHAGERDWYIFDFGVQPDGTYTAQGNDWIDAIQVADGDNFHFLNDTASPYQAKIQYLATPDAGAEISYEWALLNNHILTGVTLGRLSVVGADFIG